MHIFVTGGSGQTGPAIVSDLIAHGHMVTGLARSEKSVNRLSALGARTHHGSLDELEVLANGARAADGVIHMAFGGDVSDPASRTRRDRAAIEAMREALTGSGKPLVITSGTLVMTPGKLAREQDVPDPQSLGSLRIPEEQVCLGFADKGVRAVVLRLDPTVHGPGDYGFIPFLISTARANRRLCLYRRWREPLARSPPTAALYRLAVEKAPAGSELHAAGESGLTLQTIAHLIGRKLNLRKQYQPSIELHMSL